MIVIKPENIYEIENMLKNNKITSVSYTQNTDDTSKDGGTTISKDCEFISVDTDEDGNDVYYEQGEVLSADGIEVCLNTVMPKPISSSSLYGKYPYISQTNYKDKQSGVNYYVIHNEFNYDSNPEINYSFYKNNIVRREEFDGGAYDVNYSQSGTGYVSNEMMVTEELKMQFLNNFSFSTLAGQLLEISLYDNTKQTTSQTKKFDSYYGIDTHFTSYTDFPLGFYHLRYTPKTVLAPMFDARSRIRESSSTLTDDKIVDYNAQDYVHFYHMYYQIYQRYGLGDKGDKSYDAKQNLDKIRDYCAIVFDLNKTNDTRLAFDIIIPVTAYRQWGVASDATALTPTVLLEFNYKYYPMQYNSSMMNTGDDTTSSDYQMDSNELLDTNTNIAYKGTDLNLVDLIPIATKTPVDTSYYHADTYPPRKTHQYIAKLPKPTPKGCLYSVKDIMTNIDMQLVIDENESSSENEDLDLHKFANLSQNSRYTFNKTETAYVMSTNIANNESHTYDNKYTYSNFLAPFLAKKIKELYGYNREVITLDCEFNDYNDVANNKVISLKDDTANKYLPMTFTIGDLVLPLIKRHAKVVDEQEQLVDLWGPEYPSDWVYRYKFLDYTYDYKCIGLDGKNPTPKNIDYLDNTNTFAYKTRDGKKVLHGENIPALPFLSWLGGNNPLFHMNSKADVSASIVGDYNARITEVVIANQEEAPIGKRIAKTAIRVTMYYEGDDLPEDTPIPVQYSLKYYEAGYKYLNFKFEMDNPNINNDYHITFNGVANGFNEPLTFSADEFMRKGEISCIISTKHLEDGKVYRLASAYSSEGFVPESYEVTSIQSYEYTPETYTDITIPLSLNDNNLPKIFRVNSIKYINDGVSYPQLTCQEYGALTQSVIADAGLVVLEHPKGLPISINDLEFMTWRDIPKEELDAMYDEHDSIGCTTITTLSESSIPMYRFSFSIQRNSTYSSGGATVITFMPYINNTDLYPPIKVNDASRRVLYSNKSFYGLRQYQDPILINAGWNKNCIDFIKELLKSNRAADPHCSYGAISKTNGGLSKYIYGKL